jgi:hypothetical protein
VGFGGSNRNAFLKKVYCILPLYYYHPRCKEQENTQQASVGIPRLHSIGLVKEKWSNSNIHKVLEWLEQTKIDVVSSREDRQIRHIVASCNRESVSCSHVTCGQNLPSLKIYIASWDVSSGMNYSMSWERRIMEVHFMPVTLETKRPMKKYTLITCRRSHDGRVCI